VATSSRESSGGGRERTRAPVRDRGCDLIEEWLGIESGNNVGGCGHEKHSISPTCYIVAGFTKCRIDAELPVPTS